MNAQIEDRSMIPPTCDCGTPTGDPHTNSCSVIVLNINWDSFDAVQRHVSEWAHATFPHRTPQGVFLKLYGEIGEFVNEPTAGQELADVFILLLDLAHMCRIDIATAIRDKMQVNHGRRWHWDPDMGIAHHIKENES